MKKNIIVYIAVILCVMSCIDRRNDSFRMVDHEEVDVKNNFIAKGGPMLLIDNHIIGIEYSIDTCFYDFNIKEQTLQRFGLRGSGPEEFLYPISLQKLEKNRIGVYDLMSRQFAELKIHREDSILVKKNNETEQISPMAFRVMKNKFNSYIGFGVYDENMFVLKKDSTNNRDFYFYSYPFQDKNEEKIENKYRALAYQGFLVSNEKKDKFVYASSEGDILYWGGYRKIV